MKNLKCLVIIWALPSLIASQAIAGDFGVPGQRLRERVPVTALAAVQGGGGKVQSATGSFTVNDIIKYDSKGTAIDSGTTIGQGSSSVFLNGTGAYSTPGGSGTITASPQWQIPYYSASGTASTVTGAAIVGLQVDSTSGAPVAYAGTTCTNQAVTALNASGAATCTTLTSAYVNNSIALTGTDINTSNQVTATHISGGTNTDLAVFNSTGNVVNYGGSGPLASHNFATQISAAGALTGAQPAFTDISGTATNAQMSPFTLVTSVTYATTNLGGL